MRGPVLKTNGVISYREFGIDSIVEDKNYITDNPISFQNGYTHNSTNTTTLYTDILRTRASTI